MWHELTKEARSSQKLVVLGVIQEQHADRCRLFAQWQGFDWPILHDPINVMKTRAVPYFIAIDEAGVVVDADLKADEFDAFLNRPSPPRQPETVETMTRPELATLLKLAERNNTAEAWTTLADQHVLWADAASLDRAVAEYQKAAVLAPNDVGLLFRLGVAHRMRWDYGQGQPVDFQAAVDAWDRALEHDPNHYIYRRRIQQYGPRLIKPYPFYDWIEQARAEIQSRGEIAVQLMVDPSGAEIAQPLEEFAASRPLEAEPDPQGRIQRDVGKLIACNVVVVPGRIRPGESMRVHLQLSPRGFSHWNNESEPVKVWIPLPEKWGATSRLIEFPSPPTPESRETRRMEFEIMSPAVSNGNSNNPTLIRGYALYNVCEELGGKCLYLRQDVDIPVRFVDFNE